MRKDDEKHGSPEHTLLSRAAGRDCIMAATAEAASLTVGAAPVGWLSGAAA